MYGNSGNTNRGYSKSVHRLNEKNVKAGRALSTGI
jgi:hypothetical protein